MTWPAIRLLLVGTALSATAPLHILALQLHPAAGLPWIALGGWGILLAHRLVSDMHYMKHPDDPDFPRGPRTSTARPEALEHLGVGDPPPDQETLQLVDEVAAESGLTVTWHRVVGDEGVPVWEARVKTKRGLLTVRQGDGSWDDALAEAGLL